MNLLSTIGTLGFPIHRPSMLQMTFPASQILIITPRPGMDQAQGSTAEVPTHSRSAPIPFGVYTSINYVSFAMSPCGEEVLHSPNMSPLYPDFQCVELSRSSRTLVPSLSSLVSRRRSGGIIPTVHGGLQCHTIGILIWCGIVGCIVVAANNPENPREITPRYNHRFLH